MRLNSISRNFSRYPLLIVAAMWPLVLLTPHIPGIPRPSVAGLPWRQELGLSLLLVVALGMELKRRPKVEEARIDSAVLLLASLLGLFVVWIWLSASWAVSPYPAFHLGLQWSTCLVFFLIMVSASKSPRMIRISFIVLGGVVCILAIACAIETWFGLPLTDGNIRSDLKPILRGSGGFGEIMAMAAIIFASGALYVRRTRRAMACGITGILAWIATLQSLERAPLIGAVVGLCLLIIGAALTPPAHRRSWSRLCLLVGALGLVLFFETMPSLTTKANGPVSTVTRLNQNPISDENTRARFLFWGVGWEMFREHPLQGVGGNNYEVAFADARGKFSAQHSDSSLVGMNEDLLTVYAHNEYLQMLAELGIVGLLIFILLSLVLAVILLRALKHAQLALPALGAGSAMLAFAISSGASGSSFRNFGGSLVFFFAAAIMARISAGTERSFWKIPTKLVPLGGPVCQGTMISACMLVLITVVVLSMQASGVMLHGLAQTSPEPTKAERYYRASLGVYPASAATHLSYGLWLSNSRRAPEAVPHLSYAVESGFNSSICFVYLAGAEATAGDLAAAERTLASAVRAYPVSLLLLVRHAEALERIGRIQEAEAEFSKALSLDSRAARGWQQLIDNDIDAAYLAAKQDPSIAMPGELVPQIGVFAILRENEQRFPESIHTGFRARMRSGLRN